MALRVPDLHRNWPFPRLTNPHAEGMTGESVEWIGSCRVFSSAQLKKLRDVHAGTLVSFAYPFHSKEHLRVACDLMNMLFVVDELTDKMNPREARFIANTALDELRHPNQSRPAGQHAVSALHRSFWETISSQASSTVIQKFSRSYEAYANAFVQEATEREFDNIRSSLESYLELRRLTGAIQPSFDMILLPLEISNECLDSASVKELETIAIDLISVANDVVSFNVEQARGDFHNLVKVLMEEKDLSIQEAVDFIDDWYQERCRDFTDLLKKTVAELNNDDPMHRDLKIYIEGLAHWVTANWEWSFESKRYFGSQSKEIRRNKVVTLLPRAVAV